MNIKTIGPARQTSKSVASRLIFMDELMKMQDGESATVTRVKGALLGKLNKEEEDFDCSDRVHLRWLYQRLINVHGEKENVDYMVRFKKILDKPKT